MQERTQFEFVLDREQARRVDQAASKQYGVPSIVLMENAGRGAAEKLIELGVDDPVVICCGKGNNGGDGFVIARHLDIHRVEVRVLLFADPADLRGDARTNYDIVQKTGLTVQHCRGEEDRDTWQRHLNEAHWIVDALLGTGVQGEPRPPFDLVIDAMNRSNAPKLAIDLPSGLDCDTGDPANHTVRAMQTCTFVAAKKGFRNPQAGEYTGTVHVLGIGVPRALVDEARGWES